MKPVLALAMLLGGSVAAYADPRPTRSG